MVFCEYQGRSACLYVHVSKMAKGGGLGRGFPSPSENVFLWKWTFSFTGPEEAIFSRE